MTSRAWPGLDLFFPDPCPPDLPDLVQAALVDVPPVALEEFPPPTVPAGAWSDDSPPPDDTAPERWRLVFDDAAARDRARAAIEDLTAARGARVESIDVADEDWAARSQAGLTAVTVGHIIVAPPWDVPPSASGVRPHVVVIEPSMGFGTGHHQTTRLCLQALQAVEVAGRAVVDVGTGSGVLALAAARLGARDVLGVDVDADALLNARENAARNGLGAVRFERADLRTGSPPAADLVLANLTGALLTAQATTLVAGVHAGGHLVISGFLEHEAPAVFGAFVPPCRIFRAFEESGWMAAILDA